MKTRIFFFLALYCLCLSLINGCSFSPDHMTQPRQPSHFNGENLKIEKALTISNNHACQGTAVYQNTLFISNKHGHCYMYQLPEGNLIADFRFGSYDNGDTPKQNHANQMMFGPKKFQKSDPFPLLYITTGYSGAHDSSGAYYAKCSVERILYSAQKGWYAEIVQTIEFNDEANIPDSNIDGALYKMYQDGRFYYTSGYGYRASKKYQKIGYGWPHFYVDTHPTDITKGKLYIFSSRFCGPFVEENIITENYDYSENLANHFILTELNMPKLPATEDDMTYGDTITLYPRDITDQFETEFDIYAFQGGTMYRGKIYHAFGYGSSNPNEHNGIRVFDIAEKKVTAKLDLSATEMALWEPECCCIYNGELALSAYNMNKLNKSVNLYVLKGILAK